jgi:hypothetical protein
MLTPLDPSKLRSLIQLTLTPLGLYSPEAEELLLFTCANESHLGEYRQQVHGPALGIFQMQPATEHDIFMNFLVYHPALMDQIQEIGHDLVTNDPYAIAMARVQYLRAPEAIPHKDDIEGIWTLYKKRYNSMKGSATRDVAMSCYKKYVLQIGEQ